MVTRLRSGSPLCTECEYTVYSGYLPWSFISLLPCSILSSRNPSSARFLPPATHASPRSFLACSHHQPSLPQPSLPALTLRACVASLIPLSLPLLSPSLLLSLPPPVPSPAITLLPPSLPISLPPLVPSPTITLLPPPTSPPSVPPSFLLSLPPLVPSPTITLLPPPPSFPPSVPPTFYSPALLPCPSLPACLLPCNSIYTVCMCIQCWWAALATGYFLGIIRYGPMGPCHWNLMGPFCKEWVNFFFFNCSIIWRNKATPVVRLFWSYHY